MRLALVGLMVAGLAMFLASLYWPTLVLLMGRMTGDSDGRIVHVVFPMVAAIVLLRLGIWVPTRQFGQTSRRLHHARSKAPARGSHPRDPDYGTG